MAIQFVVETGTSSATATSYATVAQFEQYWENRGTTFSEADDVIKAWLNQATEFIDINYNFEGQPASSAQALEWPRSYCIDRNEITISSTTIPGELVDATCYLAAQVKNGDLNIVDDGVKSESFGPVSKSYSKGSAYRDYPAVQKLLKNYIISGNKLQRVN